MPPTRLKPEAAEVVIWQLLQTQRRICKPEADAMRHNLTI
tara:strand:- start:1447 stop:1566 length:120 start_codon:yes stop_codon:yes gene_type:complete